MRKLTAIIFAVLISTSAFAAPSDSSDGSRQTGVISRIVRQIKAVVRVLGLPEVPQP